MPTSHAIIVEDDRDTATLYSYILELIGYSSEVISNGQNALDRLAESQPDLVLLDLILPGGVSGMKVLNYIRTSDRLADVRVVVISGYSELVGELLNEPDLVLLKPVSVSQLGKLISRIHPAKNKLLSDVSTDSLTGLHNRSFLLKRLAFSLERDKRREDYMFSFLLLDIDNFAEINIKYGREVGDELLVFCSKRLKTCLRPTDTLSRLAKDEFAILLEDVDTPKNATMVADRIQERLQIYRTQDGQSLKISTSIGIVPSGTIYNYGEVILRDAHNAMVEAKIMEGSNYVIFVGQPGSGDTNNNQTDPDD